MQPLAVLCRTRCVHQPPRGDLGPLPCPRVFHLYSMLPAAAAAAAQHSAHHAAVDCQGGSGWLCICQQRLHQPVGGRTERVGVGGLRVVPSTRHVQRPL